MILQQYSNQGTLTISMVSLRKNSTDEFTDGKQTKMLINYVFSTWNLFDENFCCILCVSILFCIHLILHWKLINYLKIIIAVITHFVFLFFYVTFYWISSPIIYRSMTLGHLHCCTGLWISINKLLNIWEERDVYHIFIWIYRYDINK